MDRALFSMYCDLIDQIKNILGSQNPINAIIVLAFLTLLLLGHRLPIIQHDTTGVSIISIGLTGSENYSLWSHAMRIQLLGKNKLGLVDGTLNMDKFDKELSHQWNRCNAIIVGWIMSSVAKELLT
ncbi:hypothetical protein RDI58_012666 [Solanum bulbocastanum]|uniref:Retrotransposon Copia-like N-terminal domain-containing protein n=1 Tax=Solanum bulbocastanum TaxID=147425 RepID=A0AAN8TP74_SOLBU